MKTVEREKGQLRLGLRYVRDNPVLRNVIIAVAVVGTFAYNFTVTLPLLTRHDLPPDTPRRTTGCLMAAMGARRGHRGSLRRAPLASHAHDLALLRARLWDLHDARRARALVLWAEIALVPTGAFSIALHRHGERHAAS